MARLFLLLFWALTALLRSAPAAAAPPLPPAASAYWIDHSQQAGLAQAQQASFTPYRNVLSLGYIDGTAWLRLRVPASTADDPLVLRLRPNFPREVLLYDPANTRAGVIVPQRTGRIVAPEASGFQALDLGLRLTPSPQPHEVWLQFKTPTSIIVDADVLPLHVAQAEELRYLAVILLYCAFLLLTALWGAIAYALQRDHLYGLFTLRQAYALVQSMSYVGLLRFFLADHMSAATLDNSYLVLMVTAAAPVAIFEARLLREFGAPPWLYWLTMAIASLCLVNLALIVTGHPHLALHWNALLVSAAILAILFTAYSTRGIGEGKLRRLSYVVVRVGYTLLAGVVFIPVIAVLHWIPGNWLMINAMMSHAVISSLLLMFMMAIRATQQNQAFQGALLQQRLTADRLEHETAQRQEKENFLAMLAHELKNPLSVIRMRSSAETPAGRTIQRAVSDMDQVIDRVLQSEKLGQPGPTHICRWVDLAELLPKTLEKNPATERVRIAPLQHRHLRTDPGALGMILSNLLDNALKYSPPASLVDIDVDAAAQDGRNGLCIRVSNDVGDAGRPDPSQVFGKFYRAPKAHRQIGSGLGLYLISAWLKQLGGSIEYQVPPSSPADRICFALWLPLNGPQPEAQA